ncbi:MAG: metal-dependent hydrolase [Elusimicrobia bacterium]|nr:metal-dependent hydrolase [Elusimicrobiota bacterium]
MKTFRLLLALALTALPAAAAPAKAPARTRLTWYGHAAFRIVTPKGAVLMLDPWLSNPKDPLAKDGADPVAAVGKVDYILLTHGHSDHVGESVALAKKTGARLVAVYELGLNMVKLLGYPKDQAGMDTLMNAGGSLEIAGGEVRVSMTPAIHSSGLENPKAGPDQPLFVYGGDPVGFVIAIKDGPTIYDTGDSAYFSDMRLIRSEYHPDVALINAGGHFGMEPAQALLAAEAVRARYVIPHHYGTFPILTQDVRPFAAAVKKRGMTPLVMEPGQTLTFAGRRLAK